MYVAKVTTETGFEVSFRVYDGSDKESALDHAIADWRFHMPKVPIADLHIEEEEEYFGTPDR